MHSARGSNWKLWVLIVALVLVIAVLGVLCFKTFLNGRTGAKPAQTVGTLSTQVAAQDAGGKDVSDKISVTQGTMRPDGVDADARLTLLDIEWTGKRAADMPLIITVSDKSFPDEDGLSVYHYTNGAWELIGTYLIVNNAVSFQVDSLSPFAFQVISSTPEPTPTPEPTATPEPTVTPEPTATPYVIDYGKFDKVQADVFVQVDSLSEDGAYVIAFVDDPHPGATGITFFDTADADEPIMATVLLNYDGETLKTVKVEVKKDADGKYSIEEPVVEGMLFTAAPAEKYYGTMRFALASQKKFLNLDEKNENVVLDDNDVRTRWLYESVKPADGTEIHTLDYRIDSDTFYITAMEMAAAVSGEGTEAGQAIRFTSAKDSKDAMALVIFQAKAAKEAETPVNTGTLILTSTPAAAAGLDATPDPTATPNNSGGGGGATDPVVTESPTDPQPIESTTPEETQTPAETTTPEETLGPDPIESTTPENQTYTDAVADPTPTPEPEIEDETYTDANT